MLQVSPEAPGAVPAIVSEDVWRRAQPDRSPVGPGPRTERSVPARFALRGLLVCDACKRKMQGHVASRRSGAVRVGYQCRYGDDYPGDSTHPKTLFVAKERILPVLDEWLDALTAPHQLDHTVAAIVEADSRRECEPAEVRRARSSAAAAKRRLDQLMAALEAGLDPQLAVGRVQRVQSELAAAEAVVGSHGRSVTPSLEAEDVRNFLVEVGGLSALLVEADAATRHRIYEASGLALRYCRVDNREKIRASLRVGLSRVGEGT